MIDVFLYGNLGEEVGEKWTFDARTPSEVFDAIDANSGNLYRYFLEKEKEGLKYCIFLDEDNITKDQLSMDLSSRKEMHVVPGIEGAGFLKDVAKNPFFLYGAAAVGTGALLNLISGAEMFAGKAWFSEKSWGDLIGGLGDFTIEIGVAMMIQGIIDTLRDDPDPDDAEDDSQPSTASFIFSNPGQNVAQGAIVPVGYGRLRIGSHLISSSLMNSRLAGFKSLDVESSEDPAKPNALNAAQHVKVSATVNKYINVDKAG